MTQITAAFAEIAEWIEQPRQDATLREAFANTQLLCQQAAAREPSTELKQLLANVQTALATWREVWPRLGAQREFRLAVAREARLWSKKLSEGPRRAS